MNEKTSELSFRGEIGEYKVIKTQDDSITLWSEFFNEACHNLSGAYAETIYNYIEGCQVVEKIRNSKNKQLNFLDVGFGLGVGLWAVIDTLRANLEFIKDKHISYTSIELDKGLCEWSLSYLFGRQTLKNSLIDQHWDKNNHTFCLNIKLDNDIKFAATIYIGDARKTLPMASENNRLHLFNIIFQDPFSPKKNPSLWTVEWFAFLKSVADPSEASLATYSSSVSIRKSMLKAGWKIQNAKGFAEKRTMTKAKLAGETEKQLLDEMNKSPTLELYDK